jgi:hypothetical protein
MEELDFPEKLDSYKSFASPRAPNESKFTSYARNEESFWV